jgi:hypothetical protein
MQPGHGFQHSSPEQNYFPDSGTAGNRPRGSPVSGECSTSEPRRLMPLLLMRHSFEKSLYGCLSEHHAFGQTKSKGIMRKTLAAAMLASTLGIEFDEDKSWDEKKNFTVSATKLSAPPTSPSPASSKRVVHMVWHCCFLF